jgi:hypothetical protein
MTMKRTDKHTVNYQLWSARMCGLTTTCFVAPQHRRMCQEQGRKYFMTAAEYITHRMPARRHVVESETRRRWTEERIGRRRRIVRWSAA